MSTNSPRPPRPPRGGRPGGPRPGGPRGASKSGIQSGGAAGSSSDFGDTRTVILSRKSMSMTQRLKDDDGPQAQAAAPAAPAPQPSLPKASVVNGTVSCVKCTGSFPILGDEFYGAVVECPDCSAEFIIPTKEELGPAAAPAPAPAPAAPAPAPAPAAPLAPEAADPRPKGKPKGGGKKKTAAAPPKEAPSKPKRKAVKNVPAFVKDELASGEEVYVCKTAGGGGGAGFMAALPVLLATGAGCAPYLMGANSDQLYIIIPAAVGGVAAIIAFIVGMAKGGKNALVMTEDRVFCKSGSFFAETDLD